MRTPCGAASTFPSHAPANDAAAGEVGLELELQLTPASKETMARAARRRVIDHPNPVKIISNGRAPGGVFKRFAIRWKHDFRGLRPDPNGVGPMLSLQ